jgi:hypothetical protein
LKAERRDTENTSGKLAGAGKARLQFKNRCTLNKRCVADSFVLRIVVVSLNISYIPGLLRLINHRYFFHSAGYLPLPFPPFSFHFFLFSFSLLEEFSLYIHRLLFSFSVLLFHRLTIRALHTVDQLHVII